MDDVIVVKNEWRYSLLIVARNRIVDSRRQRLEMKREIEIECVPWGVAFDRKDEVMPTPTVKRRVEDQ